MDTLIFIFCLLSTGLAFTQSTGDVEIGGVCNTPNNQSGICVELKSCESLYELIQKIPLLPEDKTFLRQSQCAYNQQPFVCCPDRSSVAHLSNLLPTPGGNSCGTFLSDRILVGELAEIDEFPWMALIEYSKPNNSRDFHCGGVLINDRYVLTAAHCAVGKNIKRLGWKLSSVRLGEWDIASDNDCNASGCSDSPIDVSLEEVLAHENYNPNSVTQDNDIALVRLSRSVEFTDFILPICLPTSETLRNANYEDINFSVVGWGKTERVSFNNIKRRTSVSGVSNEQCNEVYNLTLTPNQLCAMKRTELCRADSGGPLMTLNTKMEPRFYCAGIFSFGLSPCEIKEGPGVFTKVSSYIDWISRNIRA